MHKSENGIIPPPSSAQAHAAWSKLMSAFDAKARQDFLSWGGMDRSVEVKPTEIQPVDSPEDRRRRRSDTLAIITTAVAVVTVIVSIIGLILDHI